MIFCPSSSPETLHAIEINSLQGDLTQNVSALGKDQSDKEDSDDELIAEDSDSDSDEHARHSRRLHASRQTRLYDFLWTTLMLVFSGIVLLSLLCHLIAYPVTPRANLRCKSFGGINPRRPIQYREIFREGPYSLLLFVGHRDFPSQINEINELSRDPSAPDRLGYTIQSSDRTARLTSPFVFDSGSADPLKGHPLKRQIIETLVGAPVLFASGHAGDLNQFGPFGVLASIFQTSEDLEMPRLREDRTAQIRSSLSSAFDLFTVDFGGDFSAFHADILSDQSKFLLLCFEIIQSLYRLPSPAPTVDHRVLVLVGHSMGGTVGRLALMALDQQAENPQHPNRDAADKLRKSIPLFITLGTPHSSPAWPVDHSMVDLFKQINTHLFNHHSQRICLGESSRVGIASPYRDLADPPPAHQDGIDDITLVSISSGFSDVLVVTELSELHLFEPLETRILDTHLSCRTNDNVRKYHTLYNVASGIKGVWSGIVHSNIPRCGQLVETILNTLFLLLEDAPKSRKPQPLIPHLPSSKQSFVRRSDPFFHHFKKAVETTSLRAHISHQSTIWDSVHTRFQLPSSLRHLNPLFDSEQSGFHPKTISFPLARKTVSHQSNSLASKSVSQLTVDYGGNRSRLSIESAPDQHLQFERIQGPVLELDSLSWSNSKSMGFDISDWHDRIPNLSFCLTSSIPADKIRIFATFKNSTRESISELEITTIPSRISSTSVIGISFVFLDVNDLKETSSLFFQLPGKSLLQDLPFSPHNVFLYAQLFDYSSSFFNFPSFFHLRASTGQRLLTFIEFDQFQSNQIAVHVSLTAKVTTQTANNDFYTRLQPFFYLSSETFAGVEEQFTFFYNSEESSSSETLLETDFRSKFWDLFLPYQLGKSTQVVSFHQSSVLLSAPLLMIITEPHSNFEVFISFPLFLSSGC